MLRQAAEEFATLSGVALDLAEQGDPVVVRLAPPAAAIAGR